ncbi:MAG: hypothetical protein ACOX0J_10410 [Thermoactinomyces vulgaris]
MCKEKKSPNASRHIDPKIRKRPRKPAAEKKHFLNPVEEMLFNVTPMEGT